MRHAKSSWKDSSLSDEQRPLNKRGKRAAPVVGAKLKELGIEIDLAISSPANRAHTTGRIVTEILGYEPKEILVREEVYEFSFAGSGVKQIVSEIDPAHKTVILFGHNPTFSALSADWSGGKIGDMPTAAVACFDVEIDSWKDFEGASKQMRFYIYPKMLSSDL